jgi:hypothetical protein
MEAALRQAIDDHLRPAGFTGALPHLRRRSDERIDLMSFQFYSSGGSFVVEVAGCPPSGFTTYWGEHIEPAQLRAWDVPRPRPRLGSKEFLVRGDHWFAFGLPNWEPDSGAMHPPAHYDAIAAEVMRLVTEQAEPFWDSKPFPAQ